MPSRKRFRKSKENQGGRLLNCADMDQSEIASLLGVSQVAVCHWIAGRVKPSTKNREVLSARLKIPVSAWDQPVDGAKEAPRAPRPAVAENPETTQQLAERLMGAVRSEIAKVEVDTGLDPRRRSEVLSKHAKTLNDLSRMTGEHAIDRAKILAHPEFRRAVRAITEAVRPWPDAARAIGHALHAEDAASMSSIARTDAG